MVSDMNENIEERINLQKGVFEIEDANNYNRAELKQLEEFLDSGREGGGLEWGRTHCRLRILNFQECRKKTFSDLQWPGNT